jgi:hypothetical protein
MRNHVGDHLAGLAAGAKFVLRSRQFACRPLKRDGRTVRERLAVLLDQFGLEIPGLQLADGAGAEDDEHVFRFTREVRRSRPVGIRGIDRRGACVNGIAP